MAGLKIFLAVVVILSTKDEALSCPTRSHKAAGSYPCPPLHSDSTSSPHHSSALTILCKTAPGSSSGLSSLPSGLILPTKTKGGPDTLLPSHAASFPSPTPNVYSKNYLDLVNILTKMAPSSPSNVALSVPQTPLAATHLTLLPYSPVSNTVRGSVKILKPHIAHSPHATLSAGSSPCSSGTRPGLPNGLVPPLIGRPSPGPGFPFTAPTPDVTPYSNATGENAERWDALRKPWSPADSATNAPKLIPLSRLCAQFSPASDNGTSVPVSAADPTTSPPQNPSLSDPLKVPGAEPAESSAFGDLPAPPDATPTPNPSNNTVCGGRKPSSPSVVANLFHRKHSSSSSSSVPAPPPLRPRPPALSPPCLKTTSTTTKWPLDAAPGGALPQQASVTLASISVPTPTPPFPPPPPPTSKAAGYNPAFMQLLVDRLTSRPDSPLPCLRPAFDVTSSDSSPHSRHNTSRTPTPDGPPCDWRAGAFNASAPAPNTATAPGTFLCNDPAFAHMLCKLLASSLATSKTRFPPCPPPSNINLASPFNTTSVSGV